MFASQDRERGCQALSYRKHLMLLESGWCLLGAVGNGDGVGQACRALLCPLGIFISITFWGKFPIHTAGKHQEQGVAHFSLNGDFSAEVGCCCSAPCLCWRLCSQNPSRWAGLSCSLCTSFAMGMFLQEQPAARNCLCSADVPFYSSSGRFVLH